MNAVGSTTNDVAEKPLRGHIVLLTIWTTSCLALAASRPFDTDGWWHIRAGVWMIKHQQIPSTDFFSWTTRGEVWHPSAWLFDAIVGASTQLMPGDAFLRGLTGISFVLFVAVVYSATRRAGAGPWAAVATTAVIELLMIPFTAERPQMLSFLLCAAVIVRLPRALEGSRSALITLFAIFVLWSNLHLSFTIGVVITAATAFGYAVSMRRLRWPAVALGAAIIGGALNPAGVNSYLATTKVSGFAKILDEWQHASLHELRDILVIVIVLSSIFLMTRTKRLRRLDLILPILTLFVLFLDAIRNAPYLLLLIAPELALGLGALRESRIAKLSRHRAQAIRDGFLIGFCILTIVSIPSAIPVRAASNLNYPVKGTALIPVGCRVLNEYDQGGYIIEKRWPEVEVSQDGRAIDEATVLKQNSVIKGDPGALKWLDENHVNCVLIRPDRGLVDQIRGDGWRRVSREPSGVLLIRTASQPPL